MPIVIPHGLKGLDGLNSLKPEEQNAFISTISDQLGHSGNFRQREQRANIIYMNQRFIDTFGRDAFNKMNDGSEESFKLRNNYLKEQTINKIGQEWGNPFNKDGTRNNNKGLGADWERFQELSPDAKLKLMESDYLTPKEFEDTWQKEVNKYARYKEATNKGFSGFLKNAAQSMNVTGGLYTNIDNDTNEMDNEGVKRFKKDANQKIFDRIYNEDVDNTTSKLSNEVSKAYYDLLNLDDNQIKKAFYREIKKGSYKDKNGMPNAGIGPYEAYKGESEMQDFTIDDMRQTLAKKKVYEAYLSPTMAATALNNEAQRYIKEHQGSIEKTALFAKDVAISTMSYTADKINGIAELYRASADKADPKGKPIVMVDDMGNIVDRTKTHVYSTRNGELFYRDGNGKFHSVFRKQIDRTTLHNMGKNQDGSDIQGAFGTDWMTLNPQYWTRAEQFGTLDADEQKQYEKIGFSPYKVMYDPNEESDLWYESFKMMSFGIADMAAQLIPFGVGTVGKALSTASKVGKLARGFGKVLDTTGKLLTSETKVGAGIQGVSGALGIAYAYDRGAFQETLQQNLANAEEAVVTRGRNEIYDKYNTDKEYKAEVDKLINARAVKMKAEYKAQLQKDGGNKIVDEKLLDKMLHSKAQEAVLGELLQNRIQELKSSKDYGDLMQKAINGAGDAAFNTFLPEAIKYGLVNTMGHRKFLYSNPTGVTKKISSTLKGLKEITTKDGRLRLATDASKFLTRGDKLKQLGKTAASQAWGGAWTNGTDDMQVDAAERINEDSFNRYLNSFQNGEALADTYGPVDGLFSYLKGLQNSTGQETTFNAATVGALGSLVNFAPHFTNIAKLATKEGREFYKNNYLRRAERDADGKLLKNEDGTVKYRDLGKWENFGDKLGFFIQNGVLNTYYGNKQAERDLQSHADYLNNILDSYNDFKAIEALVASNIASENAINAGDAKTIQFIKAIYAINALRSLGNNSKDPASISSVIEKNKRLIEKASQLNLEEGKNPFSEEELKQLLAEYYSANPGIEQTEANSQKALYTIAKNAQKLQEAADAFNKANEELDKMEKSKGITMDPEVKTRLSLQQALDGHWRERNEKMKSEIDDPSSDTKPTDPNVIIASVGGRKNAQTLIPVYDKQRAELHKELSEQEEKTKKLREEAEKVDKEVNEAKESVEGMLTPELQKKQKEAHAELDNSINQEKYLDDLITRTAGKRQSLKTSIDDAQVEENTQRTALAEKSLQEAQSKLEEAQKKKAGWIDETGKAKKRHGKQVEKINKEIAELEKTVNQRKEDLERSKERVLTADEIFSLDPVTRARMMEKENRDLYSKEQQREIERLEERLLMRDPDALQKIQDISLLTQRIEKNQDAYSRILQNPEAAAVDFESQRAMAAEAAYGLINRRNAESIAAFLNEYDEAMKTHSDIGEEAKNYFAFRILRKIAPTLLDIIDEEKMLPQYQHQVEMAKEWGKVTGDINAIISNADRDETWKTNLRKNMDVVVESANNKEGILSNLEKVVDDTDGSEASKDFDYVLKELEKIGYQRDATVIENRKDRREREEAARKKKEEIKEKLDKEVEAAAKKKAEERKRETKHTLNKKAILSLSPQKLGTLLGISDTEAIKKDMSKYQAEAQRQAGIIARYLDGEIGVKDALMELGYDEGYVTNSSEEDLKISLDEDVNKFKELLDKPVENVPSEDVMGSMPFHKMQMDAEVSEDTIKILAASTGKTVEEVRRAIAELRTEHNKTKYEAWGIPSSAMGNTADIITRDFFAGKLKDHYPNITDEVLEAFKDQLEAFKKDLEAKGIHIVSEGVMAHGIITTTDEKGNTHELPVAGTLDLFGYDDKGNYYIFDMKTTRNHTEAKLQNEQFKWSRQISMYADLLKQTYGISVNRDNLRIIPINVYYPGPKGTEKGMSPTGPTYSVDKQTGQLKMKNADGKTTDFIQDNKENFQLRSAKVDEQFQPGYFKLHIGWDNLTSADQDTALTLDKSETSKKTEAPANAEEAIKTILEDSKNFILSEDENYYYIKDKKTGKTHKFARVTSVISADKSVPQWKPTNQAVYDHLEGLAPAHEIAPDGSNLLPADVEKGDVAGMEFKEAPGVWKVDILLEDESGDMEVSSGEMWHGTTENPKKGTFTAEKTDSTITFGISEGDSGMKPETLTITPDEYENRGSTKRRTISESFKEIGLNSGEYVGSIIANNPKGEGSQLTHAQAEVIRRGVRKVLEDPNATVQRLHDAIVSAGRKTSANSNFLSYFYKAFDALKKGEMSIDEVMGFLEYHLYVDDATHKEFLDKGLHESVKDANTGRDFEATSMEKKDGEWYFNGNFAGSEETTQVKMKDNFSIDEAIERQQKAREAEFVAEGVDTENPNIIVEGDDVYAVSESIEGQFEEVKEKDTEISTVERNQDIDTLNEKGENEINTNETTLSGMAMGPYKSDPLIESGILERKVGRNPNDNMNQFFAWMKAEGIKVQNIIDHELAQILAVTPNAKVKFMAVNPKNTATNDRAMNTFLMLVLDYDDNINKHITSIHNDDNGGVIESNGKKYLIIGTVGYGDKKKNAEKLALYDILWSNNPHTGNGYGLMKLARAKFFNSHPNERFYVNETLSTEIVPSYPTPGWVVRQSEVDDVPGIFRSINDLLYKNGKINEDRNPYHYDLENVAWGIQEYNKFLTVNTSGKSVMSPKEPVANAGRVFILMPASNGKLFPSPVKALMYTEMRDGALKDRVDTLLQEVTALDYKTRMKAILKLAEIFYFDPNGDFILTRKTRNEISLTHDGKPFKTFVLDSNFNRAQFIEAIQEMNPRVNVTAKVLSNISLLKKYDEAGALRTDAAIFGTAGSSYSIYGLNSHGEMLKPSDPASIVPDSAGRSDFKNGDRSQVVFNHEYYVLENDKFYLNGKEVTDSKIIKQLQYNKRIIDGQLVPIVDKGVWDYYALSTGENPEVIKVDRNTKKVKELSKEEAKGIIEEVAKKKEAEIREEEAKKKNETLIKESKGKEENVDLGLDDTNLKIDPETGEMIQEEPPSSDTTPSVPVEEDSSSTTPSTDSTKTEPVEGHKTKEEAGERSSIRHKSLEGNPGEHNTGATQKFTDLLRNKTYTKRIITLVRSKWKDAPTKPSEMATFLKSKNVEVDNIGTTKEDIEAWIKTIEDCR